MVELVNELNAASTLLNSALQRYLDACSAVSDYYEQTGMLARVPRMFLDHVTNELALITSYEATIQQAKSLISQARNSSTSLVPIHSLPSEILSRIFYLVVGARPCGASDNSGNNSSLPKYPDFLTHVCSRWRRISIGLPMLWSHIDILHLHSMTPGFVARAKACAARAKHAPLEIHFQVSASHSSPNANISADFLSSAATRISP